MESKSSLLEHLKQIEGGRIRKKRATFPSAFSCSLDVSRKKLNFNLISF